MTQTTETLEDLPPSAKLVYKVLEYEGPLNHQEIADETRLPKRTVREAVERLEAVDAVESRTDLTDARRRVYRLN